MRGKCSIQRLANEVGLGAGIGIAIVLMFLGESHLKRRIVIGKRGVLAEDITETQSVLIGEAIGRAKINAQTRQRIPKQKGRHPVTMARPARLEASGLHARPAVFHLRGMFQNNVDINIGFSGKTRNGRAADMLDAFDKVAKNASRRSWVLR